jgi:hypothetical protein
MVLWRVAGHFHHEEVADVKKRASVVRTSEVNLVIKQRSESIPPETCNAMLRIETKPLWLPFHTFANLFWHFCLSPAAILNHYQSTTYRGPPACMRK